MEILLWIVTGVLAAMFAGVGAVKIASPIAGLRKMPWTSGFSNLAIRSIGVAEFLGAIGLVVPVATRNYEFLTPVAGFALAILMVGATVTHRRIGDARSTYVTTTSLLVALMILVAFRALQLA